MGGEVSEMIILAAILYFAGVVTWFIAKWVAYGIYETNLLRCALQSMLGPVWPIALCFYAARSLQRYSQTKLKQDYAELFPPKPEPSVAPARVNTSVLGEDRPRYKPGDWIN